ncbi:hypothetical protein DEAC_c24020 [Desulfosporosinus acididurans]|uniref:Uncharacterized protein n=1 Tax=Desulfosporosinus acididurans TaxID=476652 RepID=A0A0J1FR48_9FIRM|nr:ABC-three component system middle component 2 [Desulfosporosinus acididurans]KLU65772.1 hypothetical protein DEAC_c24020 [Desulfosporosinus acididurans]
MSIFYNVSLDTFIIDSIRILVLILAFEDKHGFKLTDNKIKLYDYYLKFPATMLSGEDLNSIVRQNFDEYYAFFHWKPDLIQYRKVINYLVSKDLIAVEIKDNDKCYAITSRGVELVSSLKSKYKNRLVKFATHVQKKISKISDKKIEEDILQKTNLLKRVLEV